MGTATVLQIDERTDGMDCADTIVLNKKWFMFNV